MGELVDVVNLTSEGSAWFESNQFPSTAVTLFPGEYRKIECLSSDKYYVVCLPRIEMIISVRHAVKQLRRAS
jgi:hypothetical protein